eukprot:scaffold126771_cov28-Tisochrysis_lutea.AAC.1
MRLDPLGVSACRTGCLRGGGLNETKFSRVSDWESHTERRNVSKILLKKLRPMSSKYQTRNRADVVLNGSRGSVLVRLTTSPVTGGPRGRACLAVRQRSQDINMAVQDANSLDLGQAAAWAYSWFSHPHIPTRHLTGNTAPALDTPARARAIHACSARGWRAIPPRTARETMNRCHQVPHSLGSRARGGVHTPS